MKRSKAQKSGNVERAQTEALQSTRLYLGAAAPSGQMLERLVAALHGAAAPEMTVRWNESIEGRQFDVVLRFRKGLHGYLTVIECKDLNRRVAVESVEAFVTKSRDAQANKAVMVSAVGFQMGAVKVAKRHGLKLLTIRERFHEHERVQDGPPIPGLVFYDAAFHPSDPSLPPITVREAVGELGYVFQQPVISYRGSTYTPHDLMVLQYPRCNFDLPQVPELLEVELLNEGMLTLDCEEPVSIKGFHIRRRKVHFYEAKAGEPQFDHSLRERMALRLVVTDEQGVELDSKALAGIPFGFDTELKAHEFYEAPSTGFFYWIERILPDRVDWLLVESFQHNKLMQVEGYSKQYPKGYVKVEDKKTLRRLQCRLDKLLGARKKQDQNS